MLPLEQQQQPWHLVVRVLSARNLGNEASRIKRSMAIRISLGSIVKETELVETVNGKAKWNSTFEFICNSRAVDSVLEVSMIRLAPVIHLRKTFAKALFACGAFPNNDQTEGWFPMANSNAEIKLCIFWTQDAAAYCGTPHAAAANATTPSSSSWSWHRKPNSTAMVSTADLSFKKLPNNALLLRPHHRVEGEEADATEQRCAMRPMLLVEVLQARNLIPVNRFTFNAASDPFALVTCRGTQHETEVVKNTLNPIWLKGRFEFGQVEDLDVDEDEIRIKIRDWDRLGKNEDLGEIAIRLDQLSQLHFPAWFKLAPTIYMKPNQLDLGEVQLRIQLIAPHIATAHAPPLHVGPSIPELLSPSPATPPPPSLLLHATGEAELQVERPKLVVKIIQARNLLAMDFGGSSDPYCVVQCKSQTKRTSTVSHTLCPLWEFEHTFGEEDLIGLNDEVKINLFDNDSVISDLMDDKLGSVRVPMWSVFNADISQPLWYRVDPVPTSSQQCAGEIQLALSYTNSSVNRQDIFNGKVWLLELQVSVMEYRGTIKEVNKPHCIVALTSGSAKKTRKFRSKQATNLIWPPERFKFQGTGGGVVDTDVLTVTMMERKLVLGELSIDVAHMIDRVGYFDSQGKTFTSWFDMKPHQQHRNGDQAFDGDTSDDDDDDNTSGSGMIDVSRGGKEEEKDLQDGKSYDTSSTTQSGKRSGRIRNTLSNALKHSPFKSPIAARESSIGYTDNFLTQLAAHPPSIRLQIRLLPIGEKRSRVNKKLVVRVDQLTHTAAAAASSSIPPTLQPTLVYCRCKLGCHVRESSDVEFHANVLQGNPRFYASFYFKDEIDWLLHETETRQADVERAARRLKNLTGEDQTSSVPTDQLVISILDSFTHHTLYETKTSFLDLGLLPNSATNVWSKAELPICRQDGDKQSVEAALHASFKLVNVKEEMIPLLGHIHMQLVQFKSVYVGFDVDSALRFVVRYSDGVFPSPLFVGDPCPVLAHTSEPIRFPIYNIFNRITIEVYLTSTKPQGATIVSEIAPPAPLQLVFKKLRNAKNKVIDKEKTLPCKWGSLLGSCTLSLYDLYEMEAKTVFEEDCGSKPATEKAFKMPIMDGKQVHGTLYVEARCTENGGFAGLFAANPHPPVSPDGTKPFSLVNLRHETVRAVKILNWLTAFSSHLNALLDWESPKKTMGSILVILILCCADWFAAHWFLMFPVVVLIHMMNRHRKRMNGQFESEFDLSSSNAAADSQDDGATTLSTHCRVAVISCSRKCQEQGPIQARLCVRDHPKAEDVRVLGNTGMVPFETNSALERLAPGILQADFSESKLGYTLKPSKLHRPNLQMWKYRDTLPAVPAFDFLMDNCTILENTLLVVYLVAGRDLLVRDSNGRSDPYVRFTLYDLVSKKDEKQRSSTKLRTLNPMWNSRFVFGDGLKPINVASILRVHVLDADNLRDEDMGSIEIGLKDLKHWSTPQWAKLTPPRDQPPGSDAGEICLCIKWFTIQSHFHNKAVAARNINVAEETGDEASFVPQPLQGLLAGADPTIFPNGDRDERAVTSWTRCGSMFGVELVNRRHQVLGKTLFPLGEFVKTDAKRLQPAVDLNVNIEGDFQVHLKVQLTLPDPRAEEIRAQMNEAKRADTLNPGKKYALVMNNLANAQQQLAMFNNQAERFKNLFNYTHPRRSDWMFNFLVFHAVLFILIPTRVYILLVVLFLFTEKFRPLGTMVMRFKHMLSVIPTDDDLRTVLQGPAYTNKSKVFLMTNRTPTHALNTPPPSSHAALRGSSGSWRWNSAADSVVASRRSLLQNATSTASLRFRRRRFLHPGGDATATELQTITAADAAFSGSLSFSKLRHQTTTAAGAESPSFYAMSMYERRFFAITTHGMHGWMDREVASLSNHPAIMHVLKIDNVTSELPQALLLSAKLQRQDCMFIVHTELDEEYLFLASTPQKRENWVNALTHVLGDVVEPPHHRHHL